mgnify:CR=1 FL=1
MKVFKLLNLHCRSRSINLNKLLHNVRYGLVRALIVNFCARCIKCLHGSVVDKTWISWQLVRIHLTLCFILDFIINVTWSCQIVN